MQEKIKGLGLCLSLALPAWFLGQAFPLIGAPLLAIGLGILVASIYQDRTAYEPGISFSSKTLLQLAVVLLGFGLDLNQVLALGIQSLPVIISSIGTALLIAYLLQKIFGLDSQIATLIGVGSSICGGSAIAATAPVIDAQEDDVAQAISVIFLFNVLAALIFPSLGQWLGLSHEGFALFAGTAVNDTSSVTATASAWDALHGSQILDQAMVVKLTRTLAIIPITFILSFYRMSRKSEKVATFSFKRAFPSFLPYFLGASLVTSLATSLGVDLALFDSFKLLSKFLIVMAMAAIGLKTDLVKLFKTGGPAIGLGGACWMGITLVSLMMQKLLGLW